MKLKLLTISVILLSLILRIVGLNTNPPSPYWEEVALGYDAYSLMQTGKDHHGNFLPIVALESFGDWKPAVYAYAIIPFIALFDLSVVAVRLPSALAGVAIVLGTAVLARKLGGSYLTTLFVGAISPWAILFSRAAWEANLATAFLLWGVLTFLMFLESRKLHRRYLLGSISVLLIVVSMYTYHSARIVAPLIGLGLGLLWFLEERQTQQTIQRQLGGFFSKNWRQASFLVVATTLLLAPLLTSLGSETVTQRFQETSIFSNIKIIEESNQLKDTAGNTVASRLFYHRYLLFGRELLTNYFSHFSLSFLFLTGDSNPRHSTQLFGQLYHVELVFLFLGAIAYLRKMTPKKWFLLWWLGISILPAAITLAAPHALRILLGLPVWLIIISFGVEEFIRLLRIGLRSLLTSQKLTWAAPVLIVLVLYGIQATAFLRQYSTVYPKVYASEWQYGYAEAIAAVEKARSEYPNIPIIITREQGRPAMYYWFYTTADPQEVQKAAQTAPRDQGELLEYQNIRFVRGLHEVFTAEQAIALASPEQLAAFRADSVVVLDTIANPLGVVVWKLVLIN